MKDTVHPTVHPTVHLDAFTGVRRSTVYILPSTHFGRGQSPGLAWNDPGLDAFARPKFSGVVPAQGARAIRKELPRVKPVRIASCKFAFTSFFTSTSAYSTRLERLSMVRRCESHNPKHTTSGGSDPASSAFTRPKSSRGHSRPMLLSGTCAFFAKPEAASLLAVRVSGSGEVGFTSLLHRNFTSHFTLNRAQQYGNQSDEPSRRTKLHAAQTVPEAGATPPLDAPYVLDAKEFCRTACMRRRIRLVRRDCILKGADYLPLLKAQPKQPKSATIQIRVEQDVKLRLDKYAEFIDSSAAYVVTEALKLLFNKDAEFRSWLGQHACNAETQRHTSKTSTSKGESLQLALK